MSSSSGKTPEHRPSAEPNPELREGNTLDFARYGDEQVPTPGVGGRPMNRRTDLDEINPDEVAAAPNEGASEGGTRSPRILERNRKRRAA